MLLEVNNLFLFICFYFYFIYFILFLFYFISYFYFIIYFILFYLIIFFQIIALGSVGNGCYDLCKTPAEMKEVILRHHTSIAPSFNNVSISAKTGEENCSFITIPRKLPPVISLVPYVAFVVFPHIGNAEVTLSFEVENKTKFLTMRVNKAQMSSGTLYQKIAATQLIYDCEYASKENEREKNFELAKKMALYYGIPSLRALNQEMIVTQNKLGKSDNTSNYQSGGGVVEKKYKPEEDLYSFLSECYETSNTIQQISNNSGSNPVIQRLSNSNSPSDKKKKRFSSRKNVEEPPNNINTIEENKPERSIYKDSTKYGMVGMALKELISVKWKRRFLVLRGTRLMVYKAEDSEQPDMIVLLKNCSVEQESSGKRKNIVKITDKEKKKWRFDPETNEQTKSWIEEIEKASKMELFSAPNVVTHKVKKKKFFCFDQKFFNFFFSFSFFFDFRFMSISIQIKDFKDFLESGNFS